jgi:hypothetical protein
MAQKHRRTTRPAASSTSRARGTYWIDNPGNGGEFAPGHLLYFKRGTVHALPDLIEGPVVFLAIDTPRRSPKDIIFVNPADGTPESFIRARAL